jgi:hypothetical protein
MALTLGTRGATNGKVMRLPSEAYVPGDPRPLGFLNDPDPGHIGRAAELLAQLGRVADAFRQPASGEPLEIRFCHVRHAPGLPFELFGFHVWEVDDNGELIDPFSAGALRYAIVVNQPAELQLEVAITFIMELAYRQRLNREVVGGDDRLQQIDREASASDRRARLDLAERWRFGWREALEAAVQATNEAGFVVRLHYEPDVFPDRADLNRRLPWLRRVYNDIEAARQAVDKTVSMIGGREPMVRTSGGLETIRSWTQQRLALLDVRRYMNHATRDGEVCGNGYLVFPGREPFAPYCAAPETVEIARNGTFVISNGANEVRTRAVTHVRGIEQLESPYGVSLLEPFVFSVDRARRLGEARELSQRWLHGTGLASEMRTHLEANLELIDRVLLSTTKDVERMLSFFRDHVPEARERLYLEGHERYRL